jgi:hypothetical protein
MHRSIKIAPVLLAALAVGACHKKTVAPAPPPLPAAQPSTAQTPRRARRPPQPTPPAPPAEAAPASPEAAPAPEFRLGQALTPEEERAGNAEIDLRLRHATQVLGSIGDRQLTQQQRSSLAQIRGFIAQAQQMRASDVARARSLAVRADILTQDLVSTLK